MRTQDGINYQWSDSSDTLYTHWDAADDDDHVVGDCVYMDTTGGWRRAECEMTLKGALCHIPPPSECLDFPVSFCCVFLLCLCHVYHVSLLISGYVDILFVSRHCQNGLRPNKGCLADYFWHHRHSLWSVNV